MKKVILLFGVFALAACSSTPKETPTEPTVEETTTTTPTTTPTTTTVQADMGGGATATATTPMTDSSGQFPPIEGTERASTTCTSGSDTRIIATIDRKEGGCGNVYTKFGNKTTIAMANNDMTYCDKVHDNVKSNLENGGMNCGAGAATATPTPTTETKTE